jgi:hypothetical protein
MPAERVIPVPSREFTHSVTIAGSASLSGAIDLYDYTLCGVITDSAWDGGAISFAAATTLSGTYVAVVNSAGSEVTTGSIAASKWCALDPADFAGVRYLKIQSGTSAATVNQGDATVLTLVLRVV